jgi:molybdopterin-binding protein
VTAEPLSLRGEGIIKTYKKGGFSLDVPSVEAPAGTTLALLGPSGSGKSTLLHILGLLERPDSGRVLLGGRPVDSRDRAARLVMAAVFQRPYLFKGSVGANVAYGLMARGVSHAERDERVAAALERVGLAGYEERSALALSGGEAQRVSLARALVLEPQILLVDEPLASLDPLLRRRLTHDFATILRDAHVTVVYVTHDQDEAFVVADRIAVMRDGRIVSCGSTDEISGIAVEEWTAAFLGVEPAIRGRVVGVEGGLAEVDVNGTLVVIVGEPEVGCEILLAVRPEDVVLFEPGGDLPLTTARNRLEAQVTSIEERGATFRVTLESNGAGLASSVSRAAAAELDLRVGSPVVAVFKATAVRWRPVNA